MVPKLKDILNMLEEIAPSYAAEEWDNPGLQVGYPSQEINKIIISLDPTLKAVKKASKSNAQLLFTHHPLIFKFLSCINKEIYPGNVISEALKEGISIVAAHTNLDVAQGGINDMLANLFSLNNIEVLWKRDDLKLDNAGIGRIGDLPEPMKLATMVKTVKAVLDAGRVRVVGLKNIEVRRVAVVGGSGGGMVSMVFKKGADLLITGDVRHHEALEAKTLGLALIDGGHFHTEKAALRLFADHLQGSFKDLRWDVIIEVFSDEKSPMRYE